MLQFMSYWLGSRTPEAPRWWAPTVVATRLVLLAAALWLALLAPPLAWVAMAIGLVGVSSLARSLTRITLSDMANPEWRLRSPARFVRLVLANLVEVVTAGAATLAAVESIDPGVSFAPPIDSFGRAWLSAASPIGGTGVAAESGWAQFAQGTVLLAVFAMVAVAIAAAVNGYTRRGT